MLQALNIDVALDGFLFNYDARRDPMMLWSHRHVELELNLVVSGTLTYVADGRRYQFARRTLLWLFPEQEHHMVERSEDSKCYVAVFRPGLVERAAVGDLYGGLRARRAEEGILSTVLDPESFEFLKTTIDGLLSESVWEHGPRANAWGLGPDVVFCHRDPAGLNAGLHHLLMLSWRCRSNGRAVARPEVVHPAVGKALRLLEEEDGPEGGVELARACGVTPAYLSRLFAREVGVTLAAHRNAVRLRRFWRELRGEAAGGTRRTVTEAVFAAGFGSYAQFYKVFVAAYGQGPAAVLAES